MTNLNNVVNNVEMNEMVAVTRDDLNGLNKLLGINCDSFTEKKNGLTYLSWAIAWRETIKIYPDATYKIELNDDKIPMFGNAKLGYMVYTSVTINGLERIMWLPVMDNANKTMKDESYTYDTKFKKGVVVEAIDMFDINKTVMRCLTKNLAMFGLGVNVYAGEDFPEEVGEKFGKEKEKKSTPTTTPSEKSSITDFEITGGKYKGMNVSELTDINYLVFMTKSLTEGKFADPTKLSIVENRIKQLG